MEKMVPHMTPDTRRMMIEAAMNLAPHPYDSQGVCIETVLKSVKHYPGVWFIGSLGLVTTLLYKGGEYFWMKPLLEKVQETNDELKKRELPEEILQRLEKEREEQIKKIENAICELSQAMNQSEEKKNDYLKKIEELKEFLDLLNAKIAGHVDVLKQLMQGLKERLENARQLHQDISEQDEKALKIYKQTIQAEVEFGALLEKAIEQIPPKNPGGDEQ